MLAKHTTNKTFIMLSTRFAYSPWMYYEMTAENCHEVVPDQFTGRFKHLKPAVYRLDKKKTYHYDGGNKAWEIAEAFARDFGFDYGIERFLLNKRARTGEYTGPLMVLRDC